VLVSQVKVEASRIREFVLLNWIMVLDRGICRDLLPVILLLLLGWFSKVCIVKDPVVISVNLGGLPLVPQKFHPSTTPPK